MIVDTPREREALEELAARKVITVKLTPPYGFLIGKPYCSSWKASRRGPEGARCPGSSGVDT